MGSFSLDSDHRLNSPVLTFSGTALGRARGPKTEDGRRGRTRTGVYACQSSNSSSGTCLNSSTLWVTRVTLCGRLGRLPSSDRRRRTDDGEEQVIGDRKLLSAISSYTPSRLKFSNPPAHNLLIRRYDLKGFMIFKLSRTSNPACISSE